MASPYAFVLRLWPLAIRLRGFGYGFAIRRNLCAACLSCEADMSEMNNEGSSRTNGFAARIEPP